MKKLKSDSSLSPTTIAELLPSNFLFGAATAAYQIEGAAHEDGRGKSIWDEYLTDPKFPHAGDTGDIACDHYHRYKEDVRLLKTLGVGGYRFSFAWPRLFPNGDKKGNPKGFDFYDRLLDELLKKDITPFPTLYHWDLPLALQKKYGGWLSRETLLRFRDYAAVMARTFGDRIKHWGTMNEMEVIIAGYIGPWLAPGLKRPDVRFHVGHNLMVAHGLALKAIRAERKNAKVGVVLNFNIIDGRNESKACLLAARHEFVKSYSWHLDAMLKGDYPEEIARILKKTPALGFVTPRPHSSWIKPGDMKLISQKLDFLGVNYYTRFIVDEKGRHVKKPRVRRTLMGWEVYPLGLIRLMDQLNAEFKLPPVYITENGAAFKDKVQRGKIHDHERRDFVFNHLFSIAVAIKNKIDVRGYFVWSLLDNLEWSLGFAKTFGIVHVNRKHGLKRTIKDSGLAYRDLIRAHRTSHKKS